MNRRRACAPPRVASVGIESWAHQSRYPSRSYSLDPAHSLLTLCSRFTFPRLFSRPTSRLPSRRRHPRTSRDAATVGNDPERFPFPPAPDRYPLARSFAFLLLPIPHPLQSKTLSPSLSLLVGHRAQFYLLRWPGSVPRMPTSWDPVRISFCGFALTFPFSPTSHPPCGFPTHQPTLETRKTPELMDLPSVSTCDSYSGLKPSTNSILTAVPSFEFSIPLSPPSTGSTIPSKRSFRRPSSDSHPDSTRLSTPSLLHSDMSSSAHSVSPATPPDSTNNTKIESSAGDIVSPPYHYVHSRKPPLIRSGTDSPTPILAKCKTARSEATCRSIYMIGMGEGSAPINVLTTHSCYCQGHFSEPLRFSTFPSTPMLTTSSSQPACQVPSSFMTTLRSQPVQVREPVIRTSHCFTQLIVHSAYIDSSDDVALQQ